MISFLDAWQRTKINAPSGGVREKLDAFHLTALQETVSHARARSRFYATHLKEAPPFNSLHEFTTLPFTLPGHIRKNSLAFLCVSLDEITRIITLETSGTTAQPKRIFFTRPDLESTIEFFSRVLSQLTRPAEKALILLPANTPSGAGDLLNTAMARIDGLGLVPGPAPDFNHTLDILFSHEPSVIIGMPVQVLALGESAKAKNRQTGFVRHAVLTADYVSPAVTSRISDTLGCQVWDHYGMTETGFGGGIDCTAHGGYHVRETDLFFEIIDPDTGAPAPQSQWGEIVVTPLNRRAMPLIRYRTGDMSRFLPDPCPCGSPFKRLAPVRHRYSGLIPLSNGSVLGMPDLDDVFFRIPGVVDFHAALSRDPKTPRLDITLKALDPSGIQNLDIQKFLPHSPVLQKALETGVLRLAPLGTEAFEFVDTYRSKRKIHLEASYSNLHSR
jgi:phenylacetate-coenzyme A ligase PaaK-like adenylate-forming protein